MDTNTVGVIGRNTVGENPASWYHGHDGKPSSGAVEMAIDYAREKRLFPKDRQRITNRV